MYFYRVYGYRLKSSFSFPEFPVAKDSSPADISLRFGDVDCPVATFPGPIPCRWQGDQDARFSILQVGRFHVRDGKEIIVSPAPGMQGRLLKNWILGTAFGLLLYQRGILILHGSAVALKGEAALILGAKGWGKSTLSVALCRDGFSFLTDDLAAIRWRQGHPPLIMPGPPETKLWPDTLSFLRREAASLQKIHPISNKRVLPVRDFVQKPKILKRIYILARGETDEILPLTPREAFFEIIRHSYRIDWVPESMARSKFAQWTSLVNEVPTVLFRRRFSMETLMDQASRIRADYELFS